MEKSGTGLNSERVTDAVLKYDKRLPCAAARGPHPLLAGASQPERENTGEDCTCVRSIRSALAGAAGRECGLGSGQSRIFLPQRVP